MFKIKKSNKRFQWSNIEIINGNQNRFNRNYLVFELNVIFLNSFELFRSGNQILKGCRFEGIENGFYVVRLNVQFLQIGIPVFVE